MSGLQNLRAIIRGRCLAGDGRSMAVAQLHELLHASGRVVEREGLHSRVVGEEASALRQSHRMRKDAVDVGDSGA